MILILLQTFELMEKKIFEAASGRCEVRSAELNGTLVWAKGGKVRIDLKLKDVEVKIVSDGRRWSATNRGETKGPHELEAGFAESLLATLTRAGIASSLILVVAGHDGPPPQTFPVREMKAGDPLEYVVSTPVSVAGTPVKLWLDPAGLPAKREFRLGQHTLTETYKVELDVPLKDTDFSP